MTYRQAQSRAGKAGRGKCKSRDPEKMRAAARARWDKRTAAIAREHRAADERCGRSWECSCGACNIARAKQPAAKKG